MTIKNIQKELKINKQDARLITLGNLFIGEDIKETENKILKLTNFSGSSALLFITPTKAYIFVDGRYELQAKKEVNLKQIEVIKTVDTPFTKWLKQTYLKSSPIITFNPWEISELTLQNLKTTLPKATFLPSLNEPLNLDSTKTKTFVHQKKFSGLTSKEKIEKQVSYIKKKNLDAYLITSASNSSWLLNMRSNALIYTPIFRAYVLVKKDGSYKIFANNTDLKEALPILSLKDHIKDIKKLGANFANMPAIIKDFNPNIINTPDIIDSLKPIKNKTELKGMIEAHIRDGVALTKFLYWLSKNYSDKKELDISEKLHQLRKKETNFYSESFETISAFGPNGAIVHYHPSNASNLTIKKGSLLLLDSGAQYYDGTTDVTRTIAIKKPTPEMIEKNTLVLKAHINLAFAYFEPETTGPKLDILARNILYKHNLNYEHGTGHGVGCFSNVHEISSPISIYSNTSTTLKKGMVTSIEPGFYKEKHFGIRIENLYYIDNLKNSKLLRFVPLTKVPLDKTLIDKNLLTKEEINWVNSYHNDVFKNLKKYLSKQELNWLKEATSPL